MRHEAWVVMAVVVLSCMLPSVGSAQRSCVIDSARALASREVVIALHRQEGTDTVAIAAELDHLLLAQDIADVLSPPDSLRPLVTAGTFSADGQPYLSSSTFDLRVDSIGDVASFEWTKLPADSGLGRAVEAAVRLLGERGRLPRETPEYVGPPRFRFTLGEVTGRSPRSLILFSRRVLALQLDRDVQTLQPGPLQYPAGDRRRRVEGRVQLEYVIDQAGHVDMNTVRVASATTEAMARAATESLRRSRFRPASIQGCPVPSVVRQGLAFSLMR